MDKVPEIIVCTDCLYCNKYNPCMVLTDHSRLHAILANACKMKNDGSKPNIATCSKGE